MSQKVTIITAVRNGKRTLEQTMLSVLNQTYSNVEYIVVDGASTDGTLDIITNYELRIKNGEFSNVSFRYTSESDNGIYDAWNKGLQLSNGEWICFLGSDDILLPDAVLNYMKLISVNTSINFASSKVEFVDEQLNRLFVFGKRWSNKMKRYCCIAHVGSMHKKDLFANFGNFSLKYKICSDYEFLLRNFNEIKPLFLDTVTAKMRCGGVSNGASALKETYFIKNGCRVYTKIFNYLYYVAVLLVFHVRNLAKIKDI